MDGKNKLTVKVATGVVVAGVVAGASYGGYELHRWSGQWNRAAEQGAAYPMAVASVPAELLTWREAGRIQTGLASVKSFALLPDGGVVVAGDRRLRVFSAGGVMLRDIPLGGTPQAVAVMETPRGTVLLAALPDRLVEVSLDGVTRMIAPLTGDSVVTCLSAGEDGSLWVADAGRRVVMEMDREGKVLRELGRADNARHAPGLVVPSAHLDVAVGDDGLIWVNNPGRHELEAYDARGTMVRQWGGNGTDIELFSGCCNPTDFFLLGDGRVVTAEKGTPRVKVFDPQGKLQSVISVDFAADAAGIDVSADRGGRVWVLDPVARELRIYAAGTGGRDMMPEKTTRREMLKSVGRYGALLGIVGGVGALAARRACDQTPCGRCPLLARCELDKAAEARAGQTREDRS